MKVEEDLKDLQTLRDNDYLPKIDDLKKRLEEAQKLNEENIIAARATQKELEDRVSKIEFEKQSVELVLETTRTDKEVVEQERAELRVGFLSCITL